MLGSRLFRFIPEEEDQYTPIRRPVHTNQKACTHQPEGQYTPTRKPVHTNQKASTHQPEDQYTPTRKLFVPRAFVEVVEETENTRPYRNSTPAVVQLTALPVDRLRNFFKKTPVQKVSNLLTNGCCGHPCSFTYRVLSGLCVICFVSSCVVSVRSG